MKILILGGTGAIGEALVNDLVRITDADIYVTSRKDRSQFSTDKLHYIQCNAKDLESLEQLLSTDLYDVIVDFLVYETEEFHLRCDLMCRSCSHYIFLSSCRVLAESDGLLTEDSPRLIDTSKDNKFLATNEYSLVKSREENILIDGLSTNWTIVRPYITYNVNRLQLGVFEKEWWLYRALHNRKILFSREIGEKYTTLTSGNDVARVIEAIIISGKCKGEIIHPVASKAMKWRDILKIYCDTLADVTGLNPQVVWIESMEQKLPGITRYNCYQIKYDRAINRMFDNSKALSIMPDAFTFTDPEDGLRNCLSLFLEKPIFGEVLWKMQAYMDIICGDRANTKEIEDTSMKIKYLIWRNTPYLKVLEKGIR